MNFILRRFIIPLDNRTTSFRQAETGFVLIRTHQSVTTEKLNLIFNLQTAFVICKDNLNKLNYRLYNRRVITNEINLKINKIDFFFFNSSRQGQAMLKTFGTKVFFSVIRVYVNQTKSFLIESMFLVKFLHILVPIYL